MSMEEAELEREEELVDGAECDLEELNATFDVEEFLAMGINPVRSTKARPGSEEKVLMLSARYAAGLPLWHDYDCYDHGPDENELMGASGGSPVQAPVMEELEEEEEEAEEA
jgi:hypothetical protein